MGRMRGRTSFWRPEMTDGVRFFAGGISFGRTKGTSGSEADDETQLTFYTEQYRSRRRSKGTTLGRFQNQTFVSRFCA